MHRMMTTDVLVNFKYILIFSEQVNAENLQLDPYESLVLLQTVDDDGDTNSTTTSSPTTTTTTEKPDSNNMAMSMSVSLLVLLIASVETVLNLL